MNLENNYDDEEDDMDIEIEIKVPETSDTQKLNENENEIEDNKGIIKNNNFIEEKEKVILITKYSSLSPDLFFNENIIDYKCISCGLIPSFEKANEVMCCGNLICEECLKKWKEEKKGCSICNKEELKTRDIKTENKIFYKSFKSFIIKCPYKCNWEGMWIDLEAHIYECKLSFRECKYKLIGCEYVNKNNIVKEHEQTNDNFHLNLALKFIKEKKIEKKKIKFELGETCKTICHPHIMTYMTSRTWQCDGNYLEDGCYSQETFFSSEKPRFRCVECDFDLCDKCIVHYIL